MTPDRIAEIRVRYPSLAVVAELADEIERLRGELDAWTERESADAAAGSYAGRAEIAEAQIERLARELGRAQFERDQVAQQRDALATKAQIFQDQRDGAWSTVRANAKVMAGAAALGLVHRPGDVGWQVVAGHAHQLLVAAGPSTDLHYTITGHAVCGYGEGLAEDGRRAALHGTADENDDITCATCRAYIAGRKAGASHEQRGVMQPNSEGETFEVGKFYITANRAFVFQCQEIVDGIALGREFNVSDWPCLPSHYVYRRERLEGCHQEISADEVYQRFGRGGWNPTQQATESGTDGGSRP